jgi:hypothetical protein
MDLSCPHCGFRLAMRGPRHEYCPQCIADRSQPVPLVASSLFRRLASDETAPPDSGDPLVSKAAGVVAPRRSRHAF